MDTHGIALDQITKGSTLIVIDVPEGRSRERLIRLGILSGQRIKCIEKLPGGTVVIEKNRQEIAIGATLAKTILVAYAGEDGMQQE